MTLSNLAVFGPGNVNLSTPASQDFPFITTSGNEASYAGFNQFRLYVKATDQYVAFANIPLPLMVKKQRGTYSHHTLERR